MLATPGFHHLHLNSCDPEAAIAFYTKQFPSTAPTSWGGLPALQSPTNVLILFTKVATAPVTEPQTAIWHFGWHVPDTQARRDVYLSRPEVTLMPLYTGDGGGTVFVSSDTWPGTGGVLGLTQAQIADAKARGVQPTRTGGFGYTYCISPFWPLLHRITYCEYNRFQRTPPVEQAISRRRKDEHRVGTAARGIVE
jgi:hypothetical protein